MKARTLIIGKILSIYVLGIAQILIIVIPLLIGYALFKSHIHLPGGVTLSQIPLNATAISLGLGFFVLGFVQFTGVLVGISALFPSAQEAGRYLGIAMIWAYMPFYAIGYIVSSPHSLIVNIFSYFPLTAPTMMLLRNTAGTVNVSEALPALAIVLVCATLAMLFAIRAFRYGAMEYGRRLSVRDVLR
jgi:ABC-2 type transport system permease protein